MDEADRADAAIEAALNEAKWQASRAPALRPRGTCHFCDEEAPQPKLFCSRECAEDFEIEEEAMKRIGRRGA